METIEVESRIDGTFTGWEGNTVFVLTNGQIWQQSRYSYWYHYAYRPEIEIFDKGFGRELRLVGHDNSVRVQRIR